MNRYIIGGWSQNPAEPSLPSFACTMYGMITNLKGLTTGTPASPGWSPAKTAAPQTFGQVMWTYGGGLATPDDMPADNADVQEIVDATTEQHWAGVDFDDESNMNVAEVINTMAALKPAQSSYTFLAGWGYNNPNAPSVGQAANDAVQQIAQANVADRFILMCYDTKMWSMEDIEANVGPAIERTIAHGVPVKQVILALTSKGLNDENLDYFLNQVTSKDIGGLFIWNFKNIEPRYLNTIKERLGIADVQG